MSTQLETAVKAASEKWKSAFNDGDAEGCAACYETEALMVAKPFGEFRGRDEIKAFWSKIIEDGFRDVEYINPQIETIDTSSAVLKAGWQMNNASGVITKELWVLQEDGAALLREDYFEART